MNVYYCEKWFNPGKRATRPLDEAAARRRHDARQPYTALMGSLEAPSHVISLAEPWVSVTFMDDALRGYLRYDFKETRHGKLFLTMAVYREFEGESMDPVTFAEFTFREDGHATTERRDRQSGNAFESERVVDVSANWEDYPQFGDYTSLCRKERDLQVGQ
jgi:hypothetical protein